MVVVLDVTYSCNRLCSYCNRDVNAIKKRPGLAAVDWIEVVEQLKKLQKNEDMAISIEGGEPLLLKDLPLLLEYLTQGKRRENRFPGLEQLRNTRNADSCFPVTKKQFPHFYAPGVMVTTNGSIKRPDILETPPGELCISLHHPVYHSPRSHGSSRAKEFIETVNFFSGEIFTTIMLPVSNRSISMSREIMSILRAVIFDNLYVFPVAPVGAAYRENTGVTLEQYWQFITMFLKELNIACYPTVEIQIPSILQAYLQLQGSSVEDLARPSPAVEFVGHRCTAFSFEEGEGFSQLTINPLGDVTGCCMMSCIPYFHLGNVLTSSIEEILAGERSLYLQRLFKKRRNDLKDRQCGLCGICRGGCPVTAFLFHGDISGCDLRCPCAHSHGAAESAGYSNTGDTYAKGEKSWKPKIPLYT